MSQGLTVRSKYASNLPAAVQPGPARRCRSGGCRAPAGSRGRAPAPAPPARSRRRPGRWRPSPSPAPPAACRAARRARVPDPARETVPLRPPRARRNHHLHLPPHELRRAVARGREQLVAVRVVHRARQRLPRPVAHRDAHAPLRDPEQEVHGPVERVDDPLRPLVPCSEPPSSPTKPSCGRRSASSALIACSDARSASLTRSVGVLLLLTSRSSAGPHALQQQSARHPRGLDRELQQLGVRPAHPRPSPPPGARRRAHENAGGRSCVHGRAASICAASATSVASSFGFAIELHRARQAVGVEARRHRAGGLAGVVPARRVGDRRRRRKRRPQPAAALVRRRSSAGGAGVTGVSSTSWSASGSFSRAAYACFAPERPVEHALRQHPPEAGRARGSAVPGARGGRTSRPPRGCCAGRSP